jgi:hypothetical protein
MDTSTTLIDPDQSTAVDRVTAGLATLQPTSLSEVLAVAALQTRVDTKYLVPLDAFDRLLEHWGERLRVLEIDGSRLFRYESVYFDTSALTTYRQHAHGRRRRVKVRTRAYLDSGECLLELKRVGPRGVTMKDRHPYPTEERCELNDQAREFVAERVASALDVGDLHRVITTGYRRATMIDVRSGNRITWDVNLRFANDVGERSGPGGVVLLESKASGWARPLEFELHRLGVRQLSLSKYGVGMALLDPTLPGNRWNRVLREYFGWTPARPT